MAAQTLSQRIAQLEPHFTVVLPEGAGPFPVVVMLHGCGGRQPFLDDYAEAAREAGAASLIVDSHKPRGIDRAAASLTVCTGARLQGRERAGDLYAAFAWLRTQSWADPKRLVAAGWSHGGWTILDALALRSGAEMRRATGIIDLPEEPLDGLAATFLAYPYAGLASIAGRRKPRLLPPTTAIVCGRDYIVGTKTPLAMMDRLRGHGAPVEVSVFDANTHAFDCNPAYDPRVRHDPDATRRAHSLLRELMAQAC